MTIIRWKKNAATWWKVRAHRIESQKGDCFSRTTHVSRVYKIYVFLQIYIKVMVTCISDIIFLVEHVVWKIVWNCVNWSWYMRANKRKLPKVFLCAFAVVFFLRSSVTYARIINGRVSAHFGVRVAYPRVPIKIVFRFAFFGYFSMDSDIPHSRD